MKRFLTVIINGIIASLIFVGCSQDYREPSQVQSYTEPQVGTLTEAVDPSKKIFGISLKSQQSSYPLDTQWLIFQVNNQYESNYRVHYSYMDLEVKTENGWRRIVKDTYLSPYWRLKGKSKQNFRVSLQDWKYIFRPGHYRLVMYVYSEYGELQRNWCAAEFDLTENQKEPLTVHNNINNLKLIDGLLSTYQKSSELWIEPLQSSYSLQDPYWKFSLFNYMKNEIFYDCDTCILLNVQVNGEWYLFPKKMSELLGTWVPPNSSTVLSLSQNNSEWKNITFHPGHYRVVFIAENEGIWTELEFDIIE